MFRALKGFKAQYHYLTLLVASDFDEWKVMVEGPGVTIQGSRQFNEVKAKEHAQTVAKSYIYEEKHEALPMLEDVPWQPFASGEWLSWRP